MKHTHLSHEELAERSYRRTRIGVTVGLVWVLVACVVMGLVARDAVAKPQVAAAKQSAKRGKKHRKPKPAPAAPAPVNLVPHVISVPGDFAVLCEQGIYCSDAPEVAVSFATCPPGYTVVAGGWETYGGDAPRNAVIAENHSISNRWLVVMESTFQGGQFGFGRPTTGRFRSVAQCQILLPA